MTTDLVARLEGEAHGGLDLEVIANDHDRKVITECEALCDEAAQEIRRLRGVLEQCKPILQDFARENPCYVWQGKNQDPYGVHELLRGLS